MATGLILHPIEDLQPRQSADLKTSEKQVQVLLISRVPSTTTHVNFSLEWNFPLKCRPSVPPLKDRGVNWLHFAIQI